mgnify:CR=1 FL=1
MNQTEPTIPPIPAGQLIGSVVASCVAAAGLVLVSNLQPGSESSAGLMKSTLMGVGCVLAAGLVAVVVLRSVVATPGVNIGGAMLAFSGTRLLGSLFAAVVCVMLFAPDRQPFGYAFILAAFAALVLETMILRRWSGAVNVPSATAIQTGVDAR